MSRLADTPGLSNGAPASAMRVAQDVDDTIGLAFYL